jgi:hypothetical protein
MSTSIDLGRPASGHVIRGRMEVHMDMLFVVHWRGFGPNAGGQQADWPVRPHSGFGRLLVAVAIIGAAVCLLDHAAGKGVADTVTASSYDSTREWR